MKDENDIRYCLTDQKGLLKNQSETKLNDILIKEEKNKQIDEIKNDENKCNFYLIEKDKLEDKKTSRIIFLIFIETVVFAIYLFHTTKVENDAEAIMGVVFSSFVFAIIDIIIHTILFSKTLMKNQKESIEFENKYNNLNK